MGMNEPYSTVRGSILMMSLIPDTRRVHGLILQHKRQLDVANRQTESHAMQIIRSTNTKGGTNPGNSAAATKSSGAGDEKHSSNFRKSLKCSYCDGDTHTIDNSFFLNGFLVATNSMGRMSSPKTNGLLTLLKRIQPRGPTSNPMTAPLSLLKNTIN
ncbi:unnamed protein product [Prunus armeniaca]